jgi:hypothetical protein
LASEVGEDAAVAMWRDINRELTDYENQLRMVGVEEDEIQFRLKARGNEIKEQYDVLYDTTEQVKAYKSAVKDLNNEYDELKGKVEGVLSAALDPGVGVDPDRLLEDMGLREDAINESARRLADIAQNGLKGQDWLEQFKGEVPDIWEAIEESSNPQEAAARMLKEFQQGLRPELIDKGRAKELVKTMILGERSMAKMAEEIAQELSAEMGVGIGEARLAAGEALGVDSVNMGAESGSKFEEGAIGQIKEDGAGSKFVDEFTAQVKAVHSRLTTSGKEAGERWGDGFLERVGEFVPAELVGILVDLVTPGVMANINRNGTMTGPQ